MLAIVFHVNGMTADEPLSSYLPLIYPVQCHPISISKIPFISPPAQNALEASYLL